MEQGAEKWVKDRYLYKTYILKLFPLFAIDFTVVYSHRQGFLFTAGDFVEDF